MDRNQQSLLGGIKEGKNQRELLPGKYQKSPSESVTENAYLSVMLTDLFFFNCKDKGQKPVKSLRSPKLQIQKGSEQPLPGCSGEMVRGAEVGARRRVTRAYRGTRGGSPDAGKEAKTQGG